MNKTKKLGIWMDHSIAHLIVFPIDSNANQDIECSFTHEAREESLQRGESTMHTKEQGEQNDYYRELAAIIRDYDEVLLFGPTDAKTELYYTFNENNLFADIEVEIMQADKMTENQQHAFVREYFENKKTT